MRKTIAASEAIRKANRRLSESQAGPLRACLLQDHYYPLRTFGRPSSSLWKPERCRNFAPTKLEGLPHQRYRRLSGALDLYALSQELAKFFDQSGTLVHHSRGDPSRSRKRRRRRRGALWPAPAPMRTPRSLDRSPAPAGSPHLFLHRGRPARPIRSRRGRSIRTGVGQGEGSAGRADLNEAALPLSLCYVG